MPLDVIGRGLMAARVIDIDAHVAEPITQIMEEFLDPTFKERPLRLCWMKMGWSMWRSMGGNRRSYKVELGWD